MQNKQSHPKSTNSRKNMPTPIKKKFFVFFFYVNFAKAIQWAKSIFFHLLKFHKQQISHFTAPVLCLNALHQIWNEINQCFSQYFYLCVFMQSNTVLFKMVQHKLNNSWFSQKSMDLGPVRSTLILVNFMHLAL